MRKKKVNEGKQKIPLIIFVICILLVITVGLFLYFQKDYFTISTRIDKINKTKIGNGSIYKTIGWLRVQGTNIDYPVIQGNSNEDKYPVKLESYVWSENKDELFHNNISITGHNIFNLSNTPQKKSASFKRFEELMAFVYYDFAKENQYIQLSIDNKEYIYKIFSVAFIGGSEETFIPINDDLTKYDIKEYIRVINNNNLYKYNVDVDDNDKLITLTTCTRFFDRDRGTNLYISGRLLRDGEKVRRVKVIKSKKYREIEEIWEGEENEKDSV